MCNTTETLHVQSRTVQRPELYEAFFFLQFLNMLGDLHSALSPTHFSGLHNISVWSPHLDFRVTSEISSMLPPPPIRRSQIDYLYFIIGTPNSLCYLFISMSTSAEVADGVPWNRLVAGTNKIQICAQATVEKQATRIFQKRNSSNEA